MASYLLTVKRKLLKTRLKQDRKSMRLIKKTLVTLIGLAIVLIGVVFIILPGPAILIIPLGLALLATEYPIAKRWLRIFQQRMRATAEWLDQKWRAFRR